MKTLKYIFILVLSLGALNSCLVDQSTRYDANDDGPNLAGFADARTAFSFVSDGNEYGFTVRMKLIGPTSMDVTGDIVVTVAADESSTAIANTHFRLPSTTITLKKADNYLALFPVTILTEGISAPLAKAPVLVLRVVSATGAENVINNGKKLEITLNYGCFSNLAGPYTLTIDRISTTGVPSQIIRNDEVITQTGVGTYRTTYVGHWTVDQMLPGTPGFTFTDVCNEITVSEQNLADYYANIVKGTAIGSVNPETGEIRIEYSVCYAGACNLYTCTYVPQF
jgi:hypothetical protein